MVKLRWSNESDLHEHRTMRVRVLECGEGSVRWWLRWVGEGPRRWRWGCHGSLSAWWDPCAEEQRIPTTRQRWQWKTGRWRWLDEWWGSSPARKVPCSKQGGSSFCWFAVSWCRRFGWWRRCARWPFFRRTWRRWRRGGGCQEGERAVELFGASLWGLICKVEELFGLSLGRGKLLMHVFLSFPVMWGLCPIQPTQKVIWSFRRRRVPRLSCEGGMSMLWRLVGLGGSCIFGTFSWLFRRCSGMRMRCGEGSIEGRGKEKAWWRRWRENWSE